LPALLETVRDDKVTTAEQGQEVRRPEIVELLEREVYGRIPDSAPQVAWRVKQTREVEAGGRTAIQKEIVGVVDNAACPEIEVNLSMSLTLPQDAKGRVINGVVVLDEGVSLPEGTVVHVISDAEVSSRDPRRMTADERRRVVDIVTRIAALPLEGCSEAFSGSDHDRVLYGPRS
jgi:hypothetical protein